MDTKWKADKTKKGTKKRAIGSLIKEWIMTDSVHELYHLRIEIYVWPATSHTLMWEPQLEEEMLRRLGHGRKAVVYQVSLGSRGDPVISLVLMMVPLGERTPPGELWGACPRLRGCTLFAPVRALWPAVPVVILCPVFPLSSCSSRSGWPSQCGCWCLGTVLCSAAVEFAWLLVTNEIHNVCHVVKKTTTPYSSKIGGFFSTVYSSEQNKTHFYSCFTESWSKKYISSCFI